MPLRGCPLQRSRRSRACPALPLRECHKESGSAFSVYALWPVEAFELSGEISSYDGRGFCPRLGSRLLDTSDPHSTLVEIRIGSLDAAPRAAAGRRDLGEAARELDPAGRAARPSTRRAQHRTTSTRRRPVPNCENGVVPEARLEDFGSGLTPVTQGWFVVNVRDAEWWSSDGRGARCAFDNEYGDPPVEFDQLGISFTVLEPGQTSLYHAETNQEAFLVVAGECALIVEQEERRLRRWDFFHAPPWTDTGSWGRGRGRA